MNHKNLLSIPMLLPALLAQGVPLQANATSFPVSRFVIEGNTLLATERLAPQLDPLRGETRTLDDLLEARKRIESAYREAGYGLVSIGLPRTIDADGTVRLQVRELPLDAVVITPETPAGDPDRYRNALPSLREGESPNLLRLSRELSLANENPSHGLTVDFAQRDDGIVAEVRVEESSPLKLSLTIDNTGTPETGRTRTGLIVQHANVFGLDHQATLAYTTSPEKADKVSIAALFYRIPLPALGDSLVFSANYSDVDSGRVADLFNISGQGYGAGAHYIHNLTRSAERRASLDIGVDRRVYRDIVDFSGTDIGTQVTTRPLSLQFSTGGRIGKHSYAATLGGARNLPGGDKNDDAAYAAARSGASADWRVLRASLHWSYLFGNASLLSLRGEMQHTRDPLISGEQFGVGGARSVRGLKEREISGDRGWLTTAEWLSPPLREHHRLALFADAGHVNRLESPGTPDERAASVGLGWRISGWKGFSLNVDFARVVHGAGNTEKGDHRGHLFAMWSL
ncbi:MAG: ShlB/FhaC/HecB family hemolysin secretion/activation protein [Rhodocyclales bacterium]|nr:ShlB/FhaC/HecB family hemolysin secretion/activation protein [Rhodocyclales bacterium]